MIDRCWRDLFGAFATNGRRVSNCGRFPERYRSLPDAVLSVLEKWAAGELRLNLLDHVPSALEVLKAQAQGERCVSALIEGPQILEFEEHGRDFLSFMIHDLVHAHHFFGDQASLIRQIKFAQEMLPLAEARSFVGSALEPEFEYLISDMNSHLVHLLKTLKSLSDRLGDPLVHQHLNERIPLWSELNSPSETNETHLQLLRAWDGLATRGLSPVST